MTDSDLDLAEEVAKAGRYRERAEEVRTIARIRYDPTITAALLQVAADYERMARTMELIHRSILALKHAPDGP